jgi:hypothetical protein
MRVAQGVALAASSQLLVLLLSTPAAPLLESAAASAGFRYCKSTLYIFKPLLPHLLLLLLLLFAVWLLLLLAVVVVVTSALLLLLPHILSRTSSGSVSRTNVKLAGPVRWMLPGPRNRSSSCLHKGYKMESCYETWCCGTMSDLLVQVPSTERINCRRQGATPLHACKAATLSP